MSGDATPPHPSGLRAALERGECHVWWASPDDCRPDLVALLDRGEQERFGRLQRSRDRERFVVGAALARTMVAEYAGTSPGDIGLDRTCQACGAPHGKPRVVGCDPAVELSISHSGARVAVALALGTPVGIDVEWGDGDATARLELLDDVLRPEETRRLRELPRQDRVAGFLTYWTRKEALLKATGEGLRVSLASFAVTGLGEPGRLQAWPARPRMCERVTLTDLTPGAAYVASLAVLDGARRVVESAASERLASVVA